jgi:hypothetical protein
MRWQYSTPLVLAAMLLPMLAPAARGSGGVIAGINAHTGLAAVGCLPCPAPVPGTLWTNGSCDGYGAITAEEHVPNQRLLLAVDDFWVAASCGAAAVSTVRVQMVMLPLDNPPQVGRLEIRDDVDGLPSAAVRYSVAFEEAPFIVGCILSGNHPFMVLEYAIPTPALVLTPGRYWVSPIGLDVTGTQYRIFATAGGGSLRLGEALWDHTSLSPATWTLTSDFPGFLNQPRDFAFEVDGTCSGLLTDGFENGDPRNWSPSPLH